MATIPLSYDDNGKSGSPAFVFVHGWTCDRSFFAPQYDHFGRTSRAIAVDLRSHGKTPTVDDGDYAIASYAGDVAAVIESLDVGPAVVVGHSLGGVVACALAAARPELVAAVVMVDPAPFIWPEGLKPVFENFHLTLGGPDGEATRAAMVDAMFMASDDPARKSDIVETMVRHPVAEARQMLGDLFAFDGPVALAAVQCPIASIGSDGPVNDAAAMKSINPRLLLSQTLGSGHFNQLEVPDQVNAMIERFLRISL
jgi:pimeloyl-ACP methyl ester carboxylesterase